MEPRELESLLAKVGGKYKLVTLFQKRMRELQRGLPRLSGGEQNTLWEIVAQEINTSKVDLIMGEEAEQLRKEIAVREAEDAAAEEKAEKDRGADKKALRNAQAPAPAAAAAAAPVEAEVKA